MTRRLPEEISTPRLSLRRPMAADAVAIFQAYAQDPQVCRFMVWTPIHLQYKLENSSLHASKLGAQAVGYRTSSENMGPP